jgi:hypothetical protein
LQIMRENMRQQLQQVQVDLRAENERPDRGNTNAGDTERSQGRSASSVLKYYSSDHERV